MIVACVSSVKLLVKSSPPFSMISVFNRSGPGAACFFEVFIACLMSASTKNTFSMSAVVFFRMLLRSFSLFFLKDAL